MEKGLRIITKGLTFILGIAIGTSFIIPSMAQNAADTKQSDGKYQYEINENGETYGKAIYAKTFEEEPDLIEAMGVDGTIGYIRAEDTYGKVPSSPEEALKIQEQNIKAGKTNRTIPLYDKDGKTVIGEFLISNDPSGAYIIMEDESRRSYND